MDICTKTFPEGPHKKLLRVGAFWGNSNYRKNKNICMLYLLKYMKGGGDLAYLLDFICMS